MLVNAPVQFLSERPLIKNIQTPPKHLFSSRLDPIGLHSVGITGRRNTLL